MPNRKISELASLSVADLLDLLVMVDVDDTSMAPTGTDKKITVEDLLNRLDHIRMQPSTTRPAIEVDPVTGGKFLDFAYAVQGVQVTTFDPPSPDFIDSVTYGGTGTAVYTDGSDGVVLDPIPGWVKFNATGGGGINNTIAWDTNGYPDLTTEYGRFYLYWDTLSNNNIIPWRWNYSDFAALGKHNDIRINGTSHKLEILNNSGTAQTLSTGGTTSQRALSAGVFYRIEWKVVYQPDSGSNGTITVRIYLGNSTTLALPTDEFTATFQNGAHGVSAAFGNPNGGNFNNHPMRMAAIATACTDWPGPYLGRAAALQVDGPGGAGFRYEIDNDGMGSTYVEEPFGIGSGGVIIFNYEDGEIVERESQFGTGIGIMRAVGNLANDYGNVSRERMIILDASSGRISACGHDTFRLHDPPDNEQFRAEYPGYYDPLDKLNALNTAYSNVGLGAIVAAGNPEISFTDLELTFNDVGKGLMIGGALNDTGIAPGNSTFAIAVLTTNGSAPADGDQVTVNDKTYTFRTGPGLAANEILIGASSDTALDNLVAAVKGAPTAGTTYGTGTTRPTNVNAASRRGSGAAALVEFFATVAGATGNTFPKGTPVGTNLAFTAFGDASHFTGANATNQKPYNIVRLTGPNSCIVTPTPDGTAVPLYGWKLYGFPTPRKIIGIKAGGTVAQHRATPFVFAWCRDSGSTNNGGFSTTAGSPTILDSTMHAIAVLTTTGTVPADGDQVTINDRTYTYRTGPGLAANEILIGASSNASLDNLIACVNAAAGSGTLYGAGSSQPTDVNARARKGTGSAAVVYFVAITAGTGGNTYNKGTPVGTQLAFNSYGSTTKFTGGINTSAAVHAPAAITRDDIGRFLAASTGPNTTALSTTLCSDNGCFIIQDVQVDTPIPGTTTITVDQNVLQTLDNVGYSIGYGPADASVEFEISGSDGVKAIDTMMNLNSSVQTHCVMFGGLKMLGSGSWTFSGMNPDVMWVSGAMTLRELFTIKTDGSVLVGYGPFGADTTAGGSVVQSGSKTTGVTINTLCGKITMNNAALAGGDIVTFTVTNSIVTADDVIIVVIRSGAAAQNTYRTQVAAVGTGTFDIQLANISATSRTDALVLNFFVLRGDS